MTLIEALIEATHQQIKNKPTIEVWAMRNNQGDFARYSPARLTSPIDGEATEYSYVGSTPLPLALQLFAGASIELQDAAIDYANENY